MKKLRIIMYSLVALLIIPCAILFVACNKKEEAPVAQKETCSVILVVDGHQYKSEEVEKGTALTRAKLDELLGITKMGYSFNGWYRDAALTERYNYDSSVNSPMVLFSEYTINKYNVTYVLGNGADNIVLREDYGTELPAPSNPVRSGYTFVGWDADIPATMPSEDVTITAQWRHFTVSVSSNIEGACTLADYTITNVFPGIEDIGGSLNVDIESINMGYEFLGWYIGDTCWSTKTKYSYPIESQATELVAKFQVDDSLNGFDFVSTPTSLKITGVQNKSVEVLKVPSIATEIEFGALSGLQNLRELDLPFIGGVAGAKATSLASPFGYIFGDADAGDNVHFVEFKQTISYKPDGSSSSTSKTQTFYGPRSLQKLTIHQNSFFTGMFQHLDELANLEYIYYAGSLSSWISATIPGDTANPMSGSVAKHFYYLDNNAYVELTELVVPAGIKEIRQNVFSGFSSLTKVVCDDELIKISANAFKGCSALQSIVVKTSVTNIVSGAFNNCNPACVVYYMGTAAQWATIRGTDSSKPIDSNIDGLTRYYYLDEATPEQRAEGIYWHYVGGVITLWS